MRLGSCVKAIKGTKPISITSAPSEGYRRLIQIDDLREGATPKFCQAASNEVLAEPDDVVIAWDGANAGTSGWGLAGVAGSTLAVLKKTVPNLHTPFLGHFVRAKEGFLRAKAKGATVPHIDGKVLADLDVPELSLDEQRHIAAILDKADALRAKRREAIAKLDQLLQSVFLDMFGDSDQWSQVAIGEMCAVKGGKRLPKGEDYADSPTPFRYIRVSDIEQGRILEHQLKYLKPEVQERIRRYIVSAGDVVITIAGTIGVVAPIGPSLAGANLTENAAKLVALGAVPYEAEYLAYALSTPGAQRQIQSQTGQVTIGKLALFRIEKVTVPMPPRHLQTRFVELKRAIERQAAQHAESLSLLDAAFAGLQGQAFSGAL